MSARRFSMAACCARSAAIATEPVFVIAQETRAEKGQLEDLEPSSQPENRMIYDENG